MELDLYNCKRLVYCDDSLLWLKSNKNIKAIITSLPDMEEISKDLNGWRDWLINACDCLINSLDEESIIFFYQTNRKYKGQLIDKNNIITSHFIKNGFKKVIEKIVLKQKPNTVNFFRPTYTNLFSFSKTIKAGKPTPDVIDCGKMIYKNAMGFNAITVCLDFIEKNIDTNTIYDPFCGQGSILKIGNDRGFDTIGVDIDVNQTIKAKLL